MAHSAKVISIRKVAPGLLEVRSRCCDDPLTDHVLTLGGLDREKADIQSDIDNHTAATEKMHQIEENACQLLKELTGVEADYKGCCP